MRNVKRLLIVEDDPILAIDMEEELTTRNFDVVGWASSSADAIQMIENVEIDFALLDFNLSGDTSVDVSIQLQQVGIPFAYLTGQELQVLKKSGAVCAPVLNKPANFNEIERQIKAPHAPAN